MLERLKNIEGKPSCGYQTGTSANRSGHQLINHVVLTATISPLHLPHGSCMLLCSSLTPESASSIVLFRYSGSQAMVHTTDSL